MLQSLSFGGLCPAVGGLYSALQIIQQCFFVCQTASSAALFGYPVQVLYFVQKARSSLPVRSASIAGLHAMATILDLQHLMFGC
jgi:hypothetical protein